MTSGQQGEFRFSDPTEPRILPRDGGAWFFVNWLSEKGRLTKQQGFQVDELETVLRLTAGQPNLYMSQCMFDQPVRRHPYVAYATHGYVDLDTYNVPALAGLSYDDRVREVRQRCDDSGTPQPSAIIGSGRGIYCKWYWDSPVEREHVGSIVAVNRALQRRLADLGADPKATDATRVLRITGSEHTGAKRMVQLLHLEERDGHTLTHGFDAFAREVAPAAREAPAADAQFRSVSSIAWDVRRRHATMRFSREGWHWSIIEDCYTLARLRWGGAVALGWRDAFCLVIACQMVRIFPPDTVYREIIAAVSRIVPEQHVTRELAHECGTLLRHAREAYSTGNWTQVYRYKKASLIDLLEITPAEERSMRALISDAEKRRRHVEAERKRRREAGAVERAEYEARAAERRESIAMMRAAGLSGRAIARVLDISEGEVRRLSQ